MVVRSLPVLRPSSHSGTRKDGRVVKTAPGGIGGNGEHRGVLDCASGGVGGAWIGSAAGEHPRTDPRTRTTQDGPDRLPVDSTAAQLRIAARIVPAPGADLHAANAGAR